MINFSKIPHDTFLGRLLRAPLKLIPRTAVLTILQGALRGKKWVVGSGVFGYWVGTYERDLQDFLVKKIKKGAIVFDIGANAGFFTLLASLLAGKEGKVFSFEPFPKNIFFLKKHLELNGSENVAVVENAVSDKSGQDFFLENESSAQGKLSPSGNLSVTTITIDDWIDKGWLPVPNYIKIDVEGAEINAVRGMKNLLEKNSVMLFIGFESDTFHFLKNLGYKAYDFKNGIPLGESDLKRGGDVVYVKD